MEPTNKTLRAALVKAQQDTRCAAKDGKNTHGRYAYSSKEAISWLAKDILQDHGLAFSLRGPVAMSEATETTGGDRARPLHFGHWLGVLTHECGEQEEWPVLWAIDYAQKGMTSEQRIGAAQSYAYKNELLVLLNIPRELPGQDIDRMRNLDTGPQEPAKPSPYAQMVKQAGITAANAGDVMAYLQANFKLPAKPQQADKSAALMAFDARHGLANLVDAAAEWKARQEGGE